MNNNMPTGLVNKKIFSKKLEMLVEENNISWSDVAKIAGVSRSTVSDWKRLISYPRMDKIQKLADYFGIEKSDLIEEKDLVDKKIVEDIKTNPENYELYQSIKKLSPIDKKIVVDLINNLNKR